MLHSSWYCTCYFLLSRAEVFFLYAGMSVLTCNNPYQAPCGFRTFVKGNRFKTVHVLRQLITNRSEASHWKPVARSLSNLAFNQIVYNCAFRNGYSPVRFLSRQQDAFDWACVLHDTARQFFMFRAAIFIFFFLFFLMRYCEYVSLSQQSILAFQRL